MKHSSYRILCVDDEPNVLDGIKRQLRDRFQLEFALGGEAALKVLSENGPFAAIISDMRMPGIDGVALLHAVHQKYPDTVRLMLTGNADQDCAIRAVNEGNIFRFLTKPCSAEDIGKALDDSVQQYKLITAEKELLQKTLSGSVKLLTDILSVAMPSQFGEAVKLRHMVQKLAPELGTQGAWELELGAMLSNIGCLTVPSEVLAKHQAGQQLSPPEQAFIDKVPAVGEGFIANIPRLQGVAKAILYQDKHFDGRGFPAAGAEGPLIPLGGRVLKILKDLLLLEAAGLSRPLAVEKLRERKGWYDQSILGAVRKVFGRSEQAESSPRETSVFEIRSNQLFIGQKLLANVETKDGKLLIAAGFVISEPLLERLRNYSALVGLKEPILVDCLMPTEHS